MAFALPPQSERGVHIRNDRFDADRHYPSMTLRFAPLALLCSLIPTLALAESDPSCPTPLAQQPRLHSSNEPMARDGWIALEMEAEPGTISDVRVRDAAGVDIEATAVFGERTSRTHHIFDPAQMLEPGDYELVFIHEADCFERQEITIPLQVADALAEPIDMPPTISSIDAVLYGESQLVIEVEVDTLPEASLPGWLVLEADFADPTRWPVDTLIAPGNDGAASFVRLVDGEALTEVCARATLYDLAGVASTTTELCTTDIEHREAEQNGPIGCRVGGSSPTWALGLLLGLALLRRRSRGA